MPGNQNFAVVNGTGSFPADFELPSVAHRDAASGFHDFPVVKVTELSRCARRTSFDESTM
jgi:hypothetical protein